jgi:hypothetical protein
MFNLVLTNGTEDLSLQFKVRDTDISKKWFNEFAKNYPLYETDRFSNWGKQNFITQLNQQIDIINSYQQVIDRKVSDTTNQQDLNYLHKFFEDLRGEATIGTPWFHSAPIEVQNALEKFNILIHDLESEIRTGNKHPTVVVTFKGNPRFKLSEDDMKHFTYKWQSGTVYINYCHVGKTVLDIYTNKDSIAEAVRPQTHYCADFMIKFGPSSNSVLHFLRSIMINIWLFCKRYNLKHYNVGMIPVADLITQVDRKTLVRFNKVKSVNV